MNNMPETKNRRVLVIDDNHSIHDDFRKILSPASGTDAALMETEKALFGGGAQSVQQTQFEVDSAYQGEEGILLVKNALQAGSPYAMAFVDVRMPPGLDGVETARGIWELDPDLQIVLCTAYSDYSWDEMFVKLGHRDGLLILKKPFDAVEALQLAHALTEKWGLHQQSRLKMEELERRVAKRTAELQLTNSALQTEVIEHKRAEEALRERSKLANLEADVGIAQTRGGLLAEILQSCSDAIVKHLGAAFARIWTLNEEEDVLELQASSGMYTHLDGPHSRVPVGSLKIGLIASERQPHLTNQVVGDSRVGDQEWAKSEGMIAFAGYPLLVDGRVIGVVAMFARHQLSDLTLQALASVSNNMALGIERKRAEKTLRESEKRFFGAFEHAPIGVALVSPNGRWLKVNRALCDLVGYSESELLTRTFQEITHPEDLEADLENVRRMLAGEIRTYQMEKRYLHGRGHPVTVLLSVSLVRDTQDQPLYFIAQIQDVTDRKRLEGKLFQSQKMETVGKLAGGVAHEFNSILTAIIGQSELLLGDLPEGSPLAKNATEISQAAGRAGALTRQLLAYGRKQFLRPETLDLNRVIANMEGMFHHLMGGDVVTQIIPAPGLQAVRADAGQIEQVILNLTMNAADAMPNGGKFTLETSNISLDQESVERYPELRPGEYVMLAITDTGTGMSEEVKARAFEPFFSTKGIGEGTGLGLSTCYGIIKQSGGHISVYSEPARGSIFKIYLPQVEPAPKVALQRINSPDLPHGTETILLVEDDPALREMAATLLTRLGYTVHAAADGVEALNLKQQRGTGHIDLLFTDVVMPHMSGKELADRVRSLYPHTKILFTSAYTEHSIVDQGMLNKGVELLQKPFTPSALAQKLREVLDKQGAWGPAI